MECEYCLTSIEEYLDGELDAQTAARVEAHMESCGECASYCDELRAEQAAYAHYRRDVEVTPAMWVAVETRIEREKFAAPRVEPSERVSAAARLREWLVAAFGVPRLSPAFAAALVVAAIGLTVAVMIYLKEDSSGKGQMAGGNQAPGNTVEVTPDTKPAPEATPAAPEGGVPAVEIAKDREKAVRPPAASPAPRRETVAREQTPEQLVREAEQKYLAAIALVERDVKRRRENLDPALLVKLDNALASIDLTIEETRKAVRAHPGDPVALQYLLGAYSKKIDALREMARE